jgi:hypothetical protein
MRTSDLIEALSADAATPPARLAPAFQAALAVAVVAAFAAFMALLGPRPDAMAALGTMRFPFKFVVTLALGAAAALAALRLARPETSFGAAAAPLAIAPVLLAIGVALELIATPAGSWEARLVGSNWLVCLTYVPILSALPLVALTAALRRGAPSSPTATGAIAGLLAGALGATFYAAHCPDDSPLFVAVWYTLGIAIVAGVGALVGRRALRW